MTSGHLLFSIGTTAYILIALQLEERDLTAQLGERYRDYRRRVPMLIPNFRGFRLSAPVSRASENRVAVNRCAARPPATGLW